MLAEARKSPDAYRRRLLLETLAEYDDMVRKEGSKIPVADSRPVNSVVQTVSK